VKIRFGEFTLDWDCRQLFCAGNAVEVSPKALDLLKVLVDSRPRALSKAELHERLWPATFISDATLTSLVAELRRIIGDTPGQSRFVRTVHRFGYAFCGAATELVEAHPGRAEGAAACWLIWDTGQVSLREGENILGRDRDVAAWFDSIDVSRHHARISVTGGEAILEDLESKNGTFVRGERITSRCRLVDGDQIGLGSLLVTFRASSPVASTASQISLPKSGDVGVSRPQMPMGRRRPK
jgi:DNA-binding winged helix-turn-helix (wHTH) protein